MALTFRSTTPETFVLSGVDTAGRRRTVTATKESGENSWDMTLRHPSGMTWPARYHGDTGILDAMCELMNSKDVEYRIDKGNGDRPPAPHRDLNVRVDEFGQDIAAPIRGIRRY
jgi:hypothetical protein